MDWVVVANSDYIVLQNTLHVQMADWKRRNASSVKRRRTRGTRPTKWTDILRCVAWPIGEELELELWANIFEWIPVITMGLCPFWLMFFISMEVPVFPEVQNQYGTSGLFLWDSFCGDSSQAIPGMLCTSFLIAPVIATVWIFLLALAFHTFGTFYRKE
jgi:hypothetical protein